MHPRALKLGFVINPSQVFQVVIPEQLVNRPTKSILRFDAVESERRRAEVG